MKVQNINSLECFKKLSSNKEAYLVDVRTTSEWKFVGVPDLTIIDNSTVFISWEEYPDMDINTNFEKQIMQKNIKKNDHIFLICRSGTRSLKAAQNLLLFGYKNCYNVSDGFEGQKNNIGQRSNINGWKFNKLPWKQE